MLTTRFADGAPNWTDVTVPDPGAARSFYGGLFGWEFRSAGPDAGGYGFFLLDGRITAGSMPAPADGGPSAWTVYFRCADAAGTARAAEQAHGRVLAAPVDVLGQGHTALLADRAGAPFGLWQPERRQGLDAAGEPGSLCWVELYTPDLAAAAAFYHRVLGLETSAAPLPEGTYTCLNPAGGGQDAMFGGVVPLGDDPVAARTGPYWLPYFAVADADAAEARAVELGGGIHLPVTEVADVGRVARLTDPSGARFAILEPAPRRQPGQPG
ncbi:VOC family protein [Streptomyces sp. NPDC003703]|uniref:VOC family protein n=1 Tax=Streptomyces sp. NPDC003283 TaxID=3364681 RepID=UPI0036D051F3